MQNITITDAIGHAMTQTSPQDTHWSLPGETRVAIAGDWHGNSFWVQRAIPFLAREAPGVRTILHVGDFGVWPEIPGKGFLSTVDYWCRRAAIERVLVTPGNHEDWDLLDAAFAKHPDEAVQLSNAVWVLPRGYRFALAGRTFMSFGGAASLDYAGRTVGKSWWPTEIPTEEHIAAAIAAGPVEVLITHETVDGGTAETERMLRSNPYRWSAEALAYAALSRDRVTRVWNSVNPAILAHGHMHVQDEIEVGDGRRVYSLGQDNEDGNLALLSLEDLSWEWIT
jgi:hypothetical protein